MSFSIFCIVFSVFFGVLPSQAQNRTCSSGDLESLRTFVDHLSDSRLDGWENINSSSPNCCDWPGVTCLNSGRVVELELGRRWLTGSISDSLANLTQLRTLNLSHNSLSGSIPHSLLHFPNLETLDLSNNGISGSFPATVNLPSITTINVSGNLITGNPPVWICRNSTRISVLNAGDNDFTGSLSGIGGCTSMEELNLATNSLHGELPEDLFHLTNLKKLRLQENRFSGPLSILIGNLSHLLHLDLSMNNFSGNLPDIFHRFEGLKYFLAQSNNFIGQIPTTLANSPTIASLSLRNNSMSGVINLNCTAMANLTSLNLATNQFHGRIPENLPGCLNLRTVNFARINFSENIPETFRNFHSLTYFSLSNSSITNLSATLDTLQHCVNLTTLVLTLNFPDEEMPSNHDFRFINLRTLVVANCRLGGRIPRWLSECTRLQLLDLSWNNLEGSIPPWFGNMSSLFYLDLSNNSLSGQIPRELTQMQSLINGNVSIQEPLLDFPLFVRRNQSGNGIKYRRAESFRPTLELGNNLLTGPVWPEFGNLRELHVLDLKHNNLSGSIPSSLSQMESLENLDLSFNHLNGTIPSSLSNLTFLAYFSVARNNLTGPIPTGSQFPTFSNSSFEGNSGLCGGHGTPPCLDSTNNPTHVSDNNQSRTRTRRRITIVTGVGTGLGTIFLLGLVCLLIAFTCRKKPVDQEKEDDCSAEEEGSSLAIRCLAKDNKEAISLDDILKATENFDQSHIVGCGGFGLVYKAVLPDGRKVAVKRLSGEYFQMEREFRAEIESLSRAQHPNLVLLQGYCKHKTDRLLIYTYMENGSLDYWLHEKTEGCLDWETRLRIARGAARGLAYLHLCCEPHILHRDVKSSNILLSEGFEARLADFGLARLIGNPYDTHVTTELVGTMGYIPPEYGQAGVASFKGDVYSFGVVLLELLTGRRPVDMCRPKGCRDLIEWVGRMRGEGRETEVFDPVVYDKGNKEEMVGVLEVAWVCLSENPRVRPCTRRLVSWLDNIGEVCKQIDHVG